MGIWRVSGLFSPRALTVLAVITLLGFGYFSYRFVKTSVTERSQNHKEALRVAETGMQKGLMELNRGQGPSNRTFSDSANGGEFRVQIIFHDSASVEIISVGRAGSVERRIRCAAVRSASEGPPSYSVQEWDEQ